MVPIPEVQGETRPEHPLREFGRRLKHVRERTGFSQGELATRIGVTQATVSRWECGEHLPDVPIKKLREALGLGAESLSYPARRKPKMTA